MYDMRVKLSKHGNSLGVILPASVVASLGLRAGIPFELEATLDGHLQLVPVMPRRSSLSALDLLDGMPEGGLHYEDLPADLLPVGKESGWL